MLSAKTIAPKFNWIFQYSLCIMLLSLYYVCAAIAWRKWTCSCDVGTPDERLLLRFSSLLPFAYSVWESNLITRFCVPPSKKKKKIQTWSKMCSSFRLIRENLLLMNMKSLWPAWRNIIFACQLFLINYAFWIATSCVVNLYDLIIPIP